MSDELHGQIRYVFGKDGLSYTAIAPGGADEIEISPDDFRAMSHFNGLQQIAQAINGLANAVQALADAVTELKPPEGS